MLIVPFLCQVLAVDARTGATLWNRTLAAPVNGAILLCGNINPSGITGTPVIDTQYGIISFVTLTSTNGTLDGVRSLAWALSVLDGAVIPGWPIDVQAALTAQVRCHVGRKTRSHLSSYDTLAIPMKASGEGHNFFHS